MTKAATAEFEAAADDWTHGKPNQTDLCRMAGTIARKHDVAPIADEEGNISFDDHRSDRPTQDLLARNFAALLRHELGDRKVAEVVITNSQPGNEATCASHDKIDANMTMRDAWLLTMGAELDTSSASETALWNAAWSDAKAAAFWCPRAIELLEQEAEERLHELARALMATRPDLKEMSLDEWLAEHSEQLTDAQRRAGSAILEMF